MNIGLLIILFSIILMGIGMGCLGAALLLFSGKEAEKAGRAEARKVRRKYGEKENEKTRKVRSQRYDSGRQSQSHK